MFVDSRVRAPLSAALFATLVFAALPAKATIINGPTGGPQGPGFQEAGYTKVYDLTFPSAINTKVDAVPYAYNIASQIPLASFDRVGYYVETKTPSGVLSWVSVSMNTFTTSAAKIGVPTLASQVYDAAVTNMNVFSSGSGIISGTGLDGFVTFFPYCYTAASIPGLGSVYNWNIVQNTACKYGAMEVAVPSNNQMLFSYNNFASGSQNSDLGLGNYSAPLNLDYSLVHNAATYSIADMQIYVHLTQALPTGTSEPAAIMMFGSGLAGLAFIRRRGRRSGGGEAGAAGIAAA